MGCICVRSRQGIIRHGRYPERGMQAGSGNFPFYRERDIAHIRDDVRQSTFSFSGMLTCGQFREKPVEKPCMENPACGSIVRSLWMDMAAGGSGPDIGRSGRISTKEAELMSPCGARPDMGDIPNPSMSRRPIHGAAGGEGVCRRRPGSKSWAISRIRRPLRFPPNGSRRYSRAGRCGNWAAGRNSRECAGSRHAVREPRRLPSLPGRNSGRCCSSAAGRGR